MYCWSYIVYDAIIELNFRNTLLTYANDSLNKRLINSLVRMCLFHLCLVLMKTNEYNFTYELIDLYGAGVRSRLSLVHVHFSINTSLLLKNMIIHLISCKIFRVLEGFKS